MLKKFFNLSVVLNCLLFLKTLKTPAQKSTPIKREVATDEIEEVDWLCDDWGDLELNKNSVFTYMSPVVPLFLAGFSLTSRISYSFQCNLFLDQHEQLNDEFKELITKYFQKNRSGGAGSNSEISPGSSLLPDLTVEGLVSADITTKESLLLLEGTFLCTALKDSNFLNPEPFCTSLKFLDHLEPRAGQRGLYESLKEGPVLSFLYKDLQPIWKPFHLRSSSLENPPSFVESGGEAEKESYGFEGMQLKHSNAYVSEGTPLEVLNRKNTQTSGGGTEEGAEYKVPCLIYKVSKVQGKWYFWFIAKKYFKEIEMSRYTSFAAEVLFDKTEPLGTEFLEEDLSEEGEFGIGQKFLVSKFRGNKT